MSSARRGRTLGLNVLTERGYQVDCYEKSDRVGGHWNTDYDALHLITSRDMTHFEGFPMPAEYPHFPRRDQIRDYIASYARARGHDKRISFDTEVLSVTPVDTDGPPDRRGGTSRPPAAPAPTTAC